ncbi:hypothetical protein CVIRNUC_001995 [Coccomyxa viridis]|uniref:Alcohol dehydrogenase-like C-terminal domain-containing protein n=1 Tax=Coccomyxa viridis TaxID=1274662 RepID=A0AAV1HVP7_9CHLO|nr:hypothetical protein CVIRNUC_001995 [Coccomyxa viridis]
MKIVQVAIPKRKPGEVLIKTHAAGVNPLDWKSLEAAGVHEGQRVLIHAGAGGVGSFGVQLAKARGAHVITTAGPRNIDFVKQELGADEAIDYTSTRFEDVLKANPVDVVVDPMAGRDPTLCVELIRDV